jgi:hypothetical protein
MPWCLFTYNTAPVKPHAFFRDPVNIRSGCNGAETILVGTDDLVGVIITYNKYNIRQFVPGLTPGTDRKQGYTSTEQILFHDEPNVVRYAGNK